MRCQPLNLAVVTVVGMPCLKLFGRRWGLANDDVIFAAVPLVVHLVWIITLPVLLSDAKSSESCDKRQYRVAISILFGLTVLAAVEECGIAIVALRGSMFDSHKRRWSHPLLYARSASIIAETAALIYATIIIEQPRQSCRNSSAGSTWHVPISARVFIWTSWAVLGIAYIVTVKPPSITTPRLFERGTNQPVSNLHFILGDELMFDVFRSFFREIQF